MVRYDIATFISYSLNQNAIMINSTYTPGPNINIGGQPVELTSVYYDLGTYHTADQVLSSYQLRAGINAGVITAVAGTITLAKL